MIKKKQKKLADHNMFFKKSDEIYNTLPVSVNGQHCVYYQDGYIGPSWHTQPFTLIWTLSGVLGVTENMIQ